jgi:hypothetical protein
MDTNIEAGAAAECGVVVATPACAHQQGLGWGGFGGRKGRPYGLSFA